MLDTLTQYGGPIRPENLPPIFGKRSLNELLQPKNEGYAWAEGIHLYSELRPVVGLEVAETDATAQKYLQVIEDYAHAGLVAANLFGLELLELQGNVLHFHKAGELTTDTVKTALQFSFVFTKVLYETLAQELRDQWNGFAICMDHGEAIIIRHGRTSNSSAISLSPAANRPAKRLLYGKTPSGHAELPGEWGGWLLGKPSREMWVALNLRDRNQVPVLGALENAQLEQQLRETILAHQRIQIQARATRQFNLIEASELVDQGNFSTERPLRMNAFCMRADLDGFSKKISNAFRQGEEAVEAIAKGFLKILEFGDYFEKQHYGVVRLPWEGDCVSFLIPPTGEVQGFRGKDWIAFVEEWQTFAASAAEGRRNKWATTFTDVAWAVGMTYAEKGRCLVAPVEALTRKFLIGGGAPLVIANEAQNQGKGGETLIHSSDYEAAYPIVRKMLNKVTGSEFWLGKEITLAKLQAAAIEAGRSENASKIEFAEKASTVTIPPPRPYYGGK
jgi:hypothetical protein